jgi:aryl-alcohol dehydrogenase-like predicted oxidoreductase
MEMVIGTATFGTDYGIANRGRVQSESNALEILSEAQKLGVSDLDTSPAYSNAEDIVGKFHSTYPAFNCYSKISGSALNTPIETVSSLMNSLDKLKIKSLQGLYFHNSTELMTKETTQVERIVDAILETGRVGKVGASAYQINEVEAISERYPKISLFQVPENLADQRLRNSSFINSLYQSGIEFHIRSIFLQGLLLMRKAPLNVEKAQPFLDRLSALENKLNCSRLDLCLSYVKQIEWASKFIVGVSSATQLREICSSEELVNVEIGYESEMTDYIRDPRKWLYD